MVLSQLSRFAAILGKRRKAYVKRAKHVRPVFKSGGAEIWFRDKMVPRPQVKGAVPAFRKRDQIGKQPDAGALRAAKKILELDHVLEALHEEMCGSIETRAKVSELTDAIGVFDELCKLKKALLEQSVDPRAIVHHAPVRIRFIYGPAHDSLHPEYTGPLMILGGRTGAELYGGADKYRELLEAYRQRHTHSQAEERGDESRPRPSQNSAGILVFEGEEFEIMPHELDQPGVNV